MIYTHLVKVAACGTASPLDTLVTSLPQGALGSGLEIKQGSNLPLRRAESTTHSAAKNLGSLPPSQLSPNGGNG